MNGHCIIVFILVTLKPIYVFVIFQESVLNGRMEPLGTVEVLFALVFGACKWKLYIFYTFLVTYLGDGEYCQIKSTYILIIKLSGELTMIIISIKL